MTHDTPRYVNPLRLRVKLESRRDGRRKREVGVRINLAGQTCSLGGIWLSLTRTPWERKRDTLGVGIEARWWGIDAR